MRTDRGRVERDRAGDVEGVRGVGEEELDDCVDVDVDVDGNGNAEGCVVVVVVLVSVW